MLAAGAVVLRGVRGGVEITDFQQVEVGSAEHLAFDELESVDVTFGGAIAPRHFKSGGDGCVITDDPICESFQFWTSTDPLDGLDP